MQYTDGILHQPWLDLYTASCAAIRMHPCSVNGHAPNPEVYNLDDLDKFNEDILCSMEIADGEPRPDAIPTSPAAPQGAPLDVDYVPATIYSGTGSNTRRRLDFNSPGGPPSATPSIPSSSPSMQPPTSEPVTGPSSTSVYGPTPSPSVYGPSPSPHPSAGNTPGTALLLVSA